MRRAANHPFETTNDGEVVLLSLPLWYCKSFICARSAYSHLNCPRNSPPFPFVQPFFLPSQYHECPPFRSTPVRRIRRHMQLVTFQNRQFPKFTNERTEISWYIWKAKIFISRDLDFLPITGGSDYRCFTGLSLHSLLLLGRTLGLAACKSGDAGSISSMFDRPIQARCASE